MTVGNDKITLSGAINNLQDKVSRLISIDREVEGKLMEMKEYILELRLSIELLNMANLNYPDDVVNNIKQNMDEVSNRLDGEMK